MRLSNFCHSAVLGVILLVFISCQEKSTLFKRSYTGAEKNVLSEGLLNSAGTLYYQGSVAERMIIIESNKYRSESGDFYREIGVPYLKRGFAERANKEYNMAVDIDPENWAGYWAYGLFYFYRDYENTLKYVECLDTLTPDFVDYPQSTSIDYMRGVSYLQLGQYDKSIHYLSKNLDFEINSVGKEYVEVMTYQMLAIALQKSGNHEQAEAVYSDGVKYNNNSADIYYHQATNYLALGKIIKAKKAYERAQKLFDVGSRNLRAYVEEYYAIYQEDLTELKNILDSIDQN